MYKMCYIILLHYYVTIGRPATFYNNIPRENVSFGVRFCVFCMNCMSVQNRYTRAETELPVEQKLYA